MEELRRNWKDQTKQPEVKRRLEPAPGELPKLDLELPITDPYRTPSQQFTAELEFGLPPEDEVQPLHADKPTFPKWQNLHKWAQRLLKVPTYLTTSMKLFLNMDLTAMIFADYNEINPDPNHPRKFLSKATWHLEEEHPSFSLYLKSRYDSHTFNLFLRPAEVQVKTQYNWQISRNWHFSWVTQRNVLPEVGRYSYMDLTYSRPRFRVGVGYTGREDPTYKHTYRTNLMFQLNQNWVFGGEIGFGQMRYPAYSLMTRYFSWSQLSVLSLRGTYYPKKELVFLDGSFVKDLRSIPQLRLWPQHERLYLAAYATTSYSRLEEEPPDEETKRMRQIEIMMGGDGEEETNTAAENADIKVGLIYKNYLNFWEVKLLGNIHGDVETYYSQHWEDNIKFSTQLKSQEEDEYPFGVWGLALHFYM